MKKAIFLILFLAILIPVIWIFIYKYEGEKPVVDINLPSLYLKKSYEISLSVEDKKTGLRDIRVSIQQKEKEKILLKKQYETYGFSEIFSGAKTVKDSFTIPVRSWQYGMTDGEATIRIKVSDYSWRGWNSGNILNIEKKVIIDSKPPKVDVLTKRHNIEKGGTGLIIYELFEEDIKSGVKAGDDFFPGHSGLFDNKNIYTAFFALNDTQGPGTKLVVIAEDAAGNITKRGFYHYIRDTKFKTDILNISDSFLNRKMPEFDVGEKTGSFQNKKNPLLEKFLYINKHVRKNNVEQILQVSQKSENQKLWDGRFLRLRGSARRSGFADRRIYKYKGREIDRAVHLGIDLASTANASIKAANSGRVILTQLVGIFGNSVIIDHGLGLCSLYSHLSQISVNSGDMVEKGDEIGFTGFTGLAGGDHLHFSMIVHNVFVNPVEWWDKTWIKNNITSKIDYVREMQ
ncbi:MAG: M23 family metallopeptidase [Deltaproteobacteria bacterium]|jgi:murein DD-endopeptidase MepM/ murein hydrolase activator NlpD|nr:M23 family metallopeptidase [Deltaproteobacteria bacterium]